MSIPLTVLGGFLGAGKTTALNRLLQDATDRIGVLVNDFGAVNVDANLIAAQGGDVMALTNGCVCCALGPDLGDSLAQMVDRAPDRIIVEASGVADPWRIAQLARLQRGVALDAVLVLVDAATFPAHLADPWLSDTLARQVARADLVALTKIDLATPAARAETEAALAGLRPGVRTVGLPAAMLGGLFPAPAPASRYIADAPGHGFRTWHWPAPAPLDEAALRRLLPALPPSVLRVKGLLRLGPDRVIHLLQSVGARWTLAPWEGPCAETGLVLIGTPGLPPPSALEALFAGTILAQPSVIQET